MLTRIKLTNFRQHEDLTLDFGGGLTALRGGNEAGKSTVFEAIAYALFGVKALRDGLDNVVTWGQATNSLKVELDFRVEDVSYKIKRTKSGCELNADGLIVTGQTEVSNYVAKLMKVDATAAARLTMASQTEIRGALESGPKATTELIEKLAEFDQIDQLIDLMQVELTLGNTATLEAGITAAEEALARAKERAVPFDANALKAEISTLEGLVAKLTADVEVATKAEAAAQDEFTTVRESLVKREGLVREVERAAAALLAAQTKLDSLVQVVVVADIDKRIAEAQQAIVNVQAADANAAAYMDVSKFFERADGPTYEGTIDELNADIKAQQSKVTTLGALKASLTSDLRLLEQKLTHGSCTFCGKDFSGVPEVEARNAETRAQIEDKTKALNKVKVELPEVESDLATMVAIEAASRPVFRAMDRYANVVEVADNELPPVLKWIGPDLTVATVGVAQLKLNIAEMQESQRAADQYAAKRSALSDQLAVADRDMDAAGVALAKCPEVSSVAAKVELDAARADTASARESYNNATLRLADAKRSLKDQADALQRAEELVLSSKATLDAKRADLSELEFNNALLKRVRQCRPAIADKLWTIVLAAVSTYFSEIRGSRSTVTKDSDGFKVNEHVVSSLSGSTLDSLGLAIRVALVRTFLPSAPFLLLDEPSAAMDDNRTGNMLGFLSGCGFHQTILITHETVSEDIADHIITL